MVEVKWKRKKLTVNFSFLNITEQFGSTKQTNARKSPRNFKEPKGAVGLGILAGLEQKDSEESIFRTVVLSTSQKFLNYETPVCSAEHCFKKSDVVEEMELCEEYACVISHEGDSLTQKREYFCSDFVGNSYGFQTVSSVNGNGGVLGMVSNSSVSFGGEKASFWTSDFLTSCFLCKKLLHGLDIFMYRGDKAFCSAECRCEQISIDEQQEKYRTEVRKPMDCSASSCSGALQFAAGVAAA